MNMTKHIISSATSIFYSHPDHENRANRYLFPSVLGTFQVSTRQVFGSKSEERKPENIASNENREKNKLTRGT
jgi:hypothetical protein